MRSALKILIRHHLKRSIVDPISHENITVTGVESGKILIDTATGSTLCEDREEAIQLLEPIYARFRSDMPFYLNKIVKSNTHWRFFDVTFAVDIWVRPDEEGGWQVWMGEDLSLSSNDHNEVLAYLRGLVLEMDMELENELQNIHKHMVTMFQYAK
ncbi:hypothetical protein [Laceyella putida]|uniref:Uncharacterized protein n=1 Tax=Laceyella putida TaxID=110101 RepID=A0ABW2RPA8_9BACL